MRAVGVEPTRAVKPCGFSYRLSRKNRRSRMPSNFLYRAATDDDKHCMPFLVGSQAVSLASCSLVLFFLWDVPFSRHACSNKRGRNGGDPLHPGDTKAGFQDRYRPHPDYPRLKFPDKGRESANAIGENYCGSMTPRCPHLPGSRDTGKPMVRHFQACWAIPRSRFA